MLGYHGCDEEVAEQVLSGQDNLKISRNAYDWLGQGIYFWEHNPERAWQWAEELDSISKPAVVGCIINLGNCLNLLDSENLKIVKSAYDELKRLKKDTGAEMPRNLSSMRGEDVDLVRRYLDREVINLTVNLARKRKLIIDTVRAVFVEGGPLYESAGFREKNHIQICVRSTECLIGYFRVRRGG